MKLFLPQHWPSWILVGFLWLFAKLSYRAQLFLGKNFGRLSYYLMKRRRHIAEVNLRLCFPEKNESERKELVKKTFESIGIGIFESALAWWGSDKHLRSLLHIKGSENLKTAVASGKGILILSYHSTILELAAQFICMQHASYIFYRPQKNPVIQWVLERAQKRYAKGIVLRKEMRELVKLLKAGEAVCYLGDQDYGPKHSEFVPFFAVKNAATITMAPRLAHFTGALVLPVCGGRRADGAGYDIEFLPALMDFPTADERADLTCINQFFEKGIREYPDQYLWVHRRFKTRLPGERSFY